jgi:hypothetical protein
MCLMEWCDRTKAPVHARHAGKRYPTIASLVSTKVVSPVLCQVLNYAHVFNFIAARANNSRDARRRLFLWRACNGNAKFVKAFEHRRETSARKGRGGATGIGSLRKQSRSGKKLQENGCNLRCARTRSPLRRREQTSHASIV